MPKEHPILFSGAMVRALLAGTKTQTRRLRAPRWVAGDRLWVRETHAITKGGTDPESVVYLADYQGKLSLPYPSDVRPGAPAKWKPSIFMPRWASRITLEVVRTWAEPLQDISEADAREEGITDKEAMVGQIRFPFRTAYADLWDSINGKKAPWESNPTVHATEFMVVKHD